MLQKSKSNNIMYLKFGIILPLLTAFVLNFNTEIIAQHKSPVFEEVRIEEEMEVITKDFTKSDMENLKTNLLKQGIELSYKKLKYNDAKEIVGIELTVSNNNGNKAKLRQSGDTPIAPISIRYDINKGTLALGNMNEMNDVHVAILEDVYEGHKAGHNEISKEIIIDKDGDVKVMSDDNVWVSESGDTTLVKRIEVIDVDEGTPGATKIMIKKGEPGEEDIDVQIITSTENHEGNDFVFLNDGDGKPLIIMDGKEVPDGKMQDLDHENIETIEVLKGSKAIEKYGEKAKDGVVIITSKK